jgi:hypothetical protein
MQDEAAHSTAIPREKLRRSEAAAYAHRRLGQPVSVNTLRAWAIPYKQIGRDAVYEVADLNRFIEERLANAPVRGAGVRRELAAMFRERFELLRRGVEDEGEARLRAIEFTTRAAQARFSCGLEQAKQVVAAALAARAKSKEPA